MLVLAVAVNHSPAREVTSNPQESWLKNRGWPGLRMFRIFRPGLRMFRIFRPGLRMFRMFSQGHTGEDLVIRISKLAE